ncbi:MAG TPA: carbohydrate-binding protein [Rhodoferax sp.]|nr:carbohydrate-binding protein [Rhodoferax sp.]
MKKIQLQYVVNETTSKNGLFQQELNFFLLVENLAYEKKIDIVWAGEDEVWQTLPAVYHSSPGLDKEYWQARTALISDEIGKLPGNIQFALSYGVLGEEYWDNNDSLNYHSPAKCGIQMANHHQVLNIGFSTQLEDGQKIIPLTIAVDQALQAQKVTIHWTTDDWRHSNITRCHLPKGNTLDPDGNDDKDRVQVWKGLLIVGHAFRLQYCIRCESADQSLWDNNFGHNYWASRKPLKVLILNLHCYQEKNQDFKFSQIARAIDDLDIDIVCLQEVAERWNDGEGDWKSNSARIINERLDSPYHLHTDWSHLGFDQFREGVAVLSRYPLEKRDSRYVSNSEDPFNIHARKVVMVQIAVPYIGLLNFFSCHLSWWEDGFEEQFENLREWAASKHTWHVKGTLLCGDFNIRAGSRGYELVVDSNRYTDQFLAVSSPQVYKKIFDDKRPHWQRYLNDDHRIDYIFLKKPSDLKVTSGRVLFTAQDYGTVSDHSGYLMTFEPK